MGFDVSVYVRALLKHKWPLLAAVCATLGVTLFWTLQQPKIYQAIATIAYEPAPPKPLGSRVEEVTTPSVALWYAQEFYETQNQIIESREIAETVVRKLGLQHDADFLGLDDSPKQQDVVPVQQAARVLQGRLTVDQRKGTRLVDVKVRDQSPERAKLIANAIVEAFVDKTIQDRLSTTVTALDWLSTQLSDLKKDLADSELALHRFKEEKNVLSVSLEDKQNMVANQIQQLNEALTEARASRIALSAKLEQLRAANREDPFDVYTESLASNEAVAGLRQAHREVSAEFETLSVQYGAAHPKLQELEAKRATLRQQMRREVDGAIRSVEAKLAEVRDTEAGLQRALDRAHEQGLELNLYEIEYSKLARERANNENLYNMLLERTAETDLTRMLRTTHVKPVERALTPSAPVSPRLLLNLAVGLVMGLLLGLGAVVTLDRMDRSIRSASDAEALGLTVLGVLPSIEPRKRARRRAKDKATLNPEQSRTRDLVVHALPRSSVAESFRTLRTNLTFMTAGDSYRTFVVTSASPREGKTTVATNLAISMAQNGQRVLLVDSDLRRPRMHHTFGIDVRHGVTSVLVDECPFEDAVSTTEVPGLSVLPCGPVPPNPAELLGSDGFQRLLQLAGAAYDRVVFDSPPLGAVTDAAVLASQVDGTLFVLQARVTTRDAVRGALRQIRDVTTAKLLGGILNDMVVSKGAYGYGYGYGGSYYYYYGHDTEGSDGDSSPQQHASA